MAQHSDCMVDSMKLQEEMGRYFMHKDVEGSAVMRHQDIQKGMEKGRIFAFEGPERMMKCYGKNWKRKTYWLTNSPVIRDRVSTGTKETVESATKKGLIQQLIKDRRIRHETDKWISFVQDEEDWQDDTVQAWDDVSGQALDPQEVARARQEEM